MFQVTAVLLQPQHEIDLSSVYRLRMIAQKYLNLAQNF